MPGLFSCEILHHNVWLLAAACVACFIGCVVQVGLYQRGLRASGATRLGWQFLSAQATGLSIWSTHFVSMLAYRPSAPVGFDPSLTIVSSLIAVAGAGVAFHIAMRKTPVAAAFGGLVLGLSIAAMHYCGMMAYRVQGLATWDAPLVALSILVACVFAGASLHVSTHGRGRYRRLVAVGLLMAAILGLHLIGMSAYRIAPLRLDPVETDAGAYLALGAAVLGVTLLVIGGATVTYLLDSDLQARTSLRVSEMALHDTLTGLPNRAHLRAHLARALEDATRRGKAASLAVLDLNDFKEFNAQFGESAGDDALRQCAEALRACLGEREFGARIAGDRFAVVQAPSGRAYLEDLLGALARRFAELGRIGGAVGPLRARIGVAVFPGDAGDAEQLITNAELALQRAKVERASEPCFFERRMDAQARARRHRAGDLRKAIAGDRLEVYYQKQVAVADGSLCGFEALARWPLPEGGFVSPAEFIPLAEECGLIDALGEWVLRTACREIAAVAPAVRVAVNLSPLQLQRPGLAERIAGILKETGLPAEQLELELTESAVVAEPQPALKAMLALKSLGLTLALDDFGTGHSSLSILRKFPFDKIKLDRSFLWEIETDNQAMAILRAVLALGASLDVPVLAEGIETDGQLQMLRAEACSLAQGYYLGRPAPMSALIAAGEVFNAHRPTGSARSAAA